MVDYSKWKDIEISDDEDETHPNIDTPSLFRWRHQARVERMEDQKKEKEAFEKSKISNETKLNEAKQKLLEAEKLGGDLGEMKRALEELESNATKLKEVGDELNKKEKVTPWNVDTIGKTGFTKTVINMKALRKEPEELTDEEREKRMKAFIKANEKPLKQFGMLRKYEDSKRFLQEHSHLVGEDTANYLVIWCINLAMEEKGELMGHVAHQCICMQYILELSKQLDVDPRACVGSFFSRIQVAEAEYKNSFDDELLSFKQRIEKRASEKLQDAAEEALEEERKERLGPGGLDPMEVFQALPEELKQCFESQDIPLLQETIGKMPEEQARYHMKRCVDSGLWVPDKKQENNDQPPDSDQE